VGGTLYFSADDGASGYELWKSDGTAAGTVRVKDISAGASSSTPFYLTNVGGTLYFSANDGVSGNELWKSDGTETGTVPVRLAGNQPLLSLTAIAEAGGRLFVAGTGPGVGSALFGLSLGPDVPGDYDLDGDVDGNDMLVWQRGLGSQVSPIFSGADGDGSGGVDDADLGVWQTNFGVGAGVAAAESASESTSLTAAASSFATAVDAQDAVSLAGASMLARDAAMAEWAADGSQLPGRFAGRRRANGRAK
jgi:ELWxxDGT repeat protein